MSCKPVICCGDRPGIGMETTGKFPKEAGRLTSSQR